MKIKTVPADFTVEERIDLSLRGKGDFSVYRVEKENLTTPDALRILSDWMRKPEKFFSHAGMKDRVARTIQHISLKGNGPESIFLEHISAQRIGYVSQPVKPKHLRGNRFKIVLRDLDDAEVQTIRQNLAPVVQYGLPNYFDDQRFRSQAEAKNAFALYLFRREYEAALKIYVSEVLPYAGKLSRIKKETVLREWGNWQKISSLNTPRTLHPVVAYLIHHPHDFQGAVFKLDIIDLRMMISAAQSYIWNEMLVRYLQQIVELPLVSAKGAWNELLFYRSLPADVCASLFDLHIDMPNEKWQESQPQLKNILQKILRRFKLQVADISLPGIRKIFVGEHARKAILIPGEIVLSEPEDDDLHTGRLKTTISFSLPPGSYATMVIKRLGLG